jgi:hypothetical protein
MSFVSWAGLVIALVTVSPHPLPAAPPPLGRGTTASKTAAVLPLPKASDLSSRVRGAVQHKGDRVQFLVIYPKDWQEPKVYLNLLEDLQVGVPIQRHIHHRAGEENQDLFVFMLGRTPPAQGAIDLSFAEETKGGKERIYRIELKPRAAPPNSSGRPPRP